jgi:uncharacterized protein YjbI with pentapeptide repeats
VTTKCSAYSFARVDSPDAPFARCRRDATHGEHCVLHAKEKPTEEFGAALEPLLKNPVLDISEFVFPEGFAFEVPSHTVSIRARSTVFGGPVAAMNRTFEGLAYFRGAHFLRPADFSHTTFRGTVNFQDAAFFDKVTFQSCRFQCPLVFMFMANFRAASDFRQIESDGDFVVQYAAFRSVDFSRATFAGRFKGYGLDVLERADFTYVDFQGRVLADSCHFGEANFSGSQFYAPASIGLRSDSWRWENSAEPIDLIPDDESAEMLDANESAEDDYEYEWDTAEDRYWGSDRGLRLADWPEDIKVPTNECHANFGSVLPGEMLRIYGDLRFVEFSGTNLAAVDLSGSTWPVIGRRKVLYEELELRKAIQGRDYSTFSGPDEIAALYRGLRKQYEDRLAYHEASDFHVGEMEMRRLAGYDPWSEPFGRFNLARRAWRRITRIYRRYCSLTAMYSYLSRYGESYVRPLIWTAAAITGFGALFLRAGFYDQGVGHSPLIMYRLNLISGGLPRMQDAAGALSLSLSSFFLRTSAVGMGLTPATRIIVVLESVVGASLIALFVLALRRHFKR